MARPRAWRSDEPSSFGSRGASMNLSDLLGSEVLDAVGRSIGKVHDARLVKDGPPQGAFGPAYRLEGLVVGTASFGSRLGFDRADVVGPLPLKALFRRVHASATFVEWALVREVEDGRILISARGDDLPAVPSLAS